jgi:6-phosphogluconolactonase
VQRQITFMFAFCGLLAAAACSGSNGTNGTDGATGPAGNNGTNGATGPAGATGAAGTTGPSGPAGATGAPGQAGAAGDAGVAGPAGPAGEAGAPAPSSAPPAVYTLSNNTTANEILVFTRGGDGSLSPAGSYATGGKGGAFPSQGSLAFDAATSRFFAVNHGDSSISMLQLNADGSLSLLSNVSSGGVAPASIALWGSTVYVANQGSTSAPTASANITGFTISGTTLTPLAGSTQTFGTANPTPVQIAYSPDGKVLVATEQTGNNIDTFPITGGVAGAIQSVAVPLVDLSDGGTTTGEPFGFAFAADGTLIVTEPHNGMGPASINSFTVADNGTLTPVTAVANPQPASCWITSAGSFAWSVNTAAGTISSFAIGAGGALSLVTPTGLNGTIAAKATDDAITPDHGYIYAVSSAAGEIAIFNVYSDGTLGAQPFLANLPATIGGIVAR